MDHGKGYPDRALSDHAGRRDPWWPLVTPAKQVQLPSAKATELTRGAFQLEWKIGWSKLNAQWIRRTTSHCNSVIIPFHKISNSVKRQHSNLSRIHVCFTAIRRDHLLSASPFCWLLQLRQENIMLLLPIISTEYCYFSPSPQLVTGYRI